MMEAAWDKAGDARRQQIESGSDLTFCKVFVPYYVELVVRLKPASLLEVGCGTGHLSARLAEYVPTVVAIEPSHGMYEIALQTLANRGVIVRNRTVQDYDDDICFDLIISHMCVQVVADLDVFLSGVARHMSGQSVLILVLPHPCFYNDYKEFFTSEEYEYMKESRKLVSFTITKEPGTRISNVPYSHRPLSQYFSCLRDHDLLLTDFVEVYPEPEIEALYGTPWGVPRYCIMYAEKRSKGE
ncbi:MAG: class I SAM-dependent methyltransferase [Salinivirgaceae bacterium]|nr:class I SAM-dependent methyltransferase [Salinivirgaceae bacterium]